MAISLSEYDLADEVPASIQRIDMDDGRTRVHITSGHVPGDYKDLAQRDLHRIIDRQTGPVLDLWPLDVDSFHEWRDGALDVSVAPTRLQLRIDLGRGAWRAGDAPWRPLDELQAYAEREIGFGFGDHERSRLAEEEEEPEVAPFPVWVQNVQLVVFGLAGLIAVAAMFAKILGLI